MSPATDRATHQLWRATSPLSLSDGSIVENHSCSDAAFRTEATSSSPLTGRDNDLLPRRTCRRARPAIRGVAAFAEIIAASYAEIRPHILRTFRISASAKIKLSICEERKITHFIKLAGGETKGLKSIPMQFRYI
jgi:hypothetical protein